MCNAAITFPANTDKTCIFIKDHSSILFWGNGAVNNTSTNNIEYSYDTSCTSIGYIPNTSSIFENASTGWVSVVADKFSPRYDNVTNFGDANHRLGQVFAASATINTSDEREKTNINSVPEALFSAWEEVGFKSFQFIKSVNEKGNNARVHIGLVAQPVKQIFQKYGLDASRYGFFCFDSWDHPAYDEKIEHPAEYENVEIVDVPESYETGPAQTHVEQRLVKAAWTETIHHDAEVGERYGIRYEEALCIEAAYQRWKNAKFEARLAALEAKLS